MVNCRLLNERSAWQLVGRLRARRSDLPSAGASLKVVCVVEQSLGGFELLTGAGPCGRYEGQSSHTERGTGIRTKDEVSGQSPRFVRWANVVGGYGSGGKSFPLGPLGRAKAGSGTLGTS